eukprot:SAG31_NODE_25970_length_450_cov_61.472934_1_plen_93_part_00
MATVRDYMRPRKPKVVTFICKEQDRVEVLFNNDEPKWYVGTVVKVTPTRCKVLFDVDQEEFWVRRYDQPGWPAKEAIRLGTDRRPRAPGAGE